MDDDVRPSFGSFATRRCCLSSRSDNEWENLQLISLRIMCMCFTCAHSPPAMPGSLLIASLDSCNHSSPAGLPCSAKGMLEANHIHCQFEALQILERQMVTHCTAEVSKQRHSLEPLVSSGCQDLRPCPWLMQAWLQPYIHLLGGCKCKEQCRFVYIYVYFTASIETVK